LVKLGLQLTTGKRDSGCKKNRRGSQQTRSNSSLKL
jgi:hypothetical protein